MATHEDLPVALPLSRRQTLGELIAESLRQALVSGQFRAGDRIPEEQIAAQLKVSRASVREAVALLEQERLIVRTPSRRVRVAFMCHEDAEEIFSLRSALEQLAFKQALRHDPSGVAERMAEVNGQLEHETVPARKADIDLEFHELLVRGAHHERLLESWLRLRAQLRMVLMHRAVLDNTSAPRTYRLHQQIIAALRAGDEARGVKIIEQQTSQIQIDWFRKMFPGRGDQPGSTVPASAKARRAAR